METATELFWVVFYLLGTPASMALLGLIALLVLGTVYLVKRPDG